GPRAAHHPGAVLGADHDALGAAAAVARRAGRAERREVLVGQAIAVVVGVVALLRGHLAALPAGVEHALVGRAVAVVVQPVADLGLAGRPVGLGVRLAGVGLHALAGHAAVGAGLV